MIDIVMHVLTLVAVILITVAGLVVAGVVWYVVMALFMMLKGI